MKSHVNRVHQVRYSPRKHLKENIQPTEPVDINYKEVLEMENEQNSNVLHSNGGFIRPNIPQKSQNDTQEITSKLDPFIGFTSNQSFEQKPNMVGKVLPEMMNSYSADVTFSSQANDDSLENASYSELQTTMEKEVKTMKEVPKFQCSICNKVLSSKHALKNHVKNIHKEEFKNFVEAQKEKQQMVSVEAAPPGLVQPKNSEAKVPWTIDSLISGSVISKQNVEEMQTSNPPGKDIFKSQV